jgi:hypothetical protein
MKNHKISSLGDRLVGYATLFAAGFLTAEIYLKGLSC